MIKALFEKFSGFLRSRELFSNWVSAAVHYLLTNPSVLYRRASNFTTDFGDKCINVDCRSGGRVCINPAVYGYVVRGFSLGFIREVRCDERNNTLVINGLSLPKFKRFYRSIMEVFVSREYEFINVRGKVVVDVGAFVGDSSIYFALRGARRVYAIEPHPGAYAEMIENIKLNNMEDKIIPINAALGSKPGKIKIPNINVYNTIDAYHGPGSNGDIEVQMITLEQLIRDYNVEPEVLKMDCEGCEFDIILNDYEHVKLFDELGFEYHERVGHKLTELLSKLNNDYECRTISGSGLIHCVKLN